MNPFETYISELRTIHFSGIGVKETSYYGPLSTLFNTIGKTLKPAALCIINPRNQGSGIPDGGFYTPDQYQKASSEDQILSGPAPARGVLEVKGTSEDVIKLAESGQVAKYWTRYSQVLATNLRDFVLVGKDSNGQRTILETYRLAATEAEFWSLAAQPRKLADIHEARFTEYLKRVMMQAAELATAQDVAWFLASYARDAKSRIETMEVPALASVRAALEEALGLKFEGKKGDDFFRSTLIQTIFYGIFSAWVLWSKKPESRGISARFDWRSAAWELHVPMIRALFDQVATPTQLGRLGLVEVLNWTGAALNRVNRDAFFEKFDQGLAVQYFYEPFLQAFDPELRKELGVWYTPPEIVQYMVARVDTVLREELDIPDGLADPRVYVLDPCCGTGAYLVEVLKRIHATLDARGGDALSGSDLKRAAMERVFGFEILPAPFVIAHLQLGLLLQNAGAPLSDQNNERAGVYLTNALTGWEPSKGPKEHLLFPEMEAERDAADEVKQAKPILVILGNPPYNGFAGVAVEEERGLSDAYRKTKSAPAPQGQGLNDLYVRFFRMAERKIVEHTGQGVVCFISNYSWLEGLSFTGMRERYIDAFDKIWIDNLHGDRKISEYAPDGRTSETVFAMERTSLGIKIGTAIGLLVAKPPQAKSNACEIFYRDRDQARAMERRAGLIDSLRESDFNTTYDRLQPVLQIGLPLKPRSIGVEYLRWPLLPELFPISYPGIQSSRDDVVVDIDKDRLLQRMLRYFDPEISHEEMGCIAPSVMKDTARFKAIFVRNYLLKRGFLRQNIVRFSYRPFDTRWIYWDPETKLLDEKRPDYFMEVFEGNMWLAAVQQNRRAFDPPCYLTRHCSRHIIERGANLFPLLVSRKGTVNLFTGDAAASDNGPISNLTEAARGYLISRGAPDDAANLFHHTLAMLHAPLNAHENSGALRQDWPRIPLPAALEALQFSATLGRQIALLLDTESQIPAITTGALRPEIKTIAVISRVDGGQLGTATDALIVTAGWGYAGKDGVTMPGKGKSVEREYTSEEMWAIEEGAKALGMAPELVTGCLGDRTHDIYLNDNAYWKNVPTRVWDYTIGGYQVMKKWLSYRENRLLGRELTTDEVREVTAMARRIAAILLLEPSLNANYQAVKAAAYPWPQSVGMPGQSFDEGI